MEKILIPHQDSNLLNELAKSCKDARERERLRALYALSIGHPVQTVAQIFSVNESTVYEWIQRWLEEKTLKEKIRSGRPAVLDENDKEIIRRLIDEGQPKKHGLNAGMWDCKELQEYFHLKGKDISAETLRKCLVAMGAHYVKSELHYAEADLQKQKDFANEIIKKIDAKDENTVVLFEDEMSAGCSVRKGYGWTFEKRLVITAPQKGGRKRLNCFGAVEPFNGEIIEVNSKTGGSQGFISLLEKAECKYLGKKILLYTDNCRIHHSKKVKLFLEKHRNIEVHYFPSYSPDLNPQEQWWKHKRKKLLNNTYFHSEQKLLHTMHSFARKTPAAEIRSICALTPIYNLLH